MFYVICQEEYFGGLGGPLIEYFQKNLLSSEQVCKIFYAIATAVQHMHDRNPPITHRDLKVFSIIFNLDTGEV